MPYPPHYNTSEAAEVVFSISKLTIRRYWAMLKPVINKLNYVRHYSFFSTLVFSRLTFVFSRSHLFNEYGTPREPNEQ